jgi:predicted AlkP superfamily pyrophosphatase or phosphodiesterase
MLRKTLLLLLLVFATAGAVPAQERARKGPTVLLISIDGLRPDYVTEAGKHGLKIPNLRRFLAEGSYSTGVHGVLPTVTYPSHTTMITGVSPARHGIYDNHPFDPLEKNQSGWTWYSEDIRVPTLWDAAMQAGLVTANVHWPVSVGAKMTFNLPQIWRAGNEEDRKLLRALSTPGLQAELEKDFEPYPDGIDESITGDERRARFAIRLFEKKRPDFMTVYLTALDTEEHDTGPFSPTSLAVLERIDALIGALRSAAEKISGGHAVVCVVSDHGFVHNDKDFNLTAAFREAGLLQYDAHDKITSWTAIPWSAGGVGPIFLKDPADNATRARVKALLDRLAGDPANGIEKILSAEEVRALGGFPGAEFLVAMKPEFNLGYDPKGPLVTAAKLPGNHGYLPEFPDMNSSFFIVGEGIPRGKSLGQIDMRDIAPTLARILRVALPAAEGADVLHAQP